MPLPFTVLTNVKSEKMCNIFLRPLLYLYWVHRHHILNKGTSNSIYSNLFHPIFQQGYLDGILLALDVVVVVTGGVERGEWEGRVAWTASGHCWTGTEAVLSEGDVSAEKSNAVVGRSGDTTGGGRGEYCGNAGKVKWCWFRGDP